MNPPLTARLLVGFAAVLASGGLAVVACSDGDATPATKTDASVADVGTSDVQTATDTGTACPESPPKSCTAKGCTTQLGEPAVCVKNACVKLKSTECPTVAGPYDDDNAIVVAAFQDVYGTRKTTGVGRMNSHELAVTEINGRGGIRRKDRCAAARAAEITAIVAAAIVRRCVDEAKKQRTVGVGFVPDQRVHATPYQQERL